MYFDGMKDLKARQLDPEFVIAIINRANDKIEDIQQSLLDKAKTEGTESITFIESQIAVMSKMFTDLMDITAGVADLTELLTIGAAEYIQEKYGLSDEEIREMSESDLEEALTPFLETQHTFAKFNNTYVRDMLYEIAKYILSDTEFIMIAIGM